jgi:hypothetical protein
VPARLPSRLNGRPWFMEREKFFNDFLTRARDAAFRDRTIEGQF